MIGQCQNCGAPMELVTKSHKWCGDTCAAAGNIRGKKAMNTRIVERVRMHQVRSRKPAAFRQTPEPK